MSTLHTDESTNLKLKKHLAASEERFRLFVEMVPHGLQECDIDGVITFSNPAHAILLEYEPSELIGKRVWEFLEDESEQKKLRDFLKSIVVEQPKPIPYIARNRTKSGRLIDLQIDWTYKRDGDGQILGFVSVLSDITERNKSAHSLKQLNDNLELSIKIRTADLEKANQHLRDEIRDRRKAEKSANLLGRVIENSLNEIYTFDARSLHFIEVNRGACQNLGYSIEEMRDLTPLDLKPNLPTAQFSELLESLRSGHLEIVRFSTDHRRKNGTLYPVSVFLQLIHEDSVFVAIILDETERRQSELKLQESQRRTLEAQRIAKLGHWDWDIQNEKLYWSDEAFQIFGLEPTEFEATFQAFLDRVHKDDHNKVQTAIRRAISFNTPYNIDHRIVRPDGDVFMVHGEGEVKRNAEGQPVRMIGTVQDITTRYRTEQALLANESKFRRVVESVGDAIVMIDMDGKICLINRQGERMFGYSRDEIIGKPVKMLIPLDCAEYQEQERKRKSNNPGFRPLGENIQMLGRHKNGTEFPTEVSLGPVDTPEGLLFVCNIRDVSERKQAEEERRQHQEELAHMARLNTVGELTTGLAHELNQPLGAMLLYANEGMAALENQAAPDLELLRKMFDNVAGLATQSGKIIRRLRRLVKKNESSLSPVDISRTIEDVLATMRSSFEKMNVRVEQIGTSHCCLTMIDDIQIQQVLLNLIRNSLEAMCDTTPEQRVLRIDVSTNSDNNIEVTVADNGVGVPSESTDAIFETFFTTKSDGTGMGLSISQTIIKAHGGQLWMTPNPKQGATFHFTLQPAKTETND